MGYSHKKHQQASSKIPRDSQGHFVHASDTSPSPSLTSDIQKEINISHTSDDNTLVDVHLGNPLHRITQLLEEIKKQKAFSFDIKGSLGVAGILVVLTTFGIFGGTHALCSRGVQSQIGYVRELQYVDTIDNPLFERIKNTWNVMTGHPVESNNTNRTILITRDQTSIHLLSNRQNDPSTYANTVVIATGDYDTCSQTLTLSQPNSLEPAQK